jgi:hypothetical protein
MRKMSTYSVANLPRLSAAKLSELLLAQSSASANLDAPATASKIAVVDVRDDGEYLLLIPNHYAHQTPD